MFIVKYFVPSAAMEESGDLDLIPDGESEPCTRRQAEVKLEVKDFMPFDAELGLWKNPLTNQFALIAAA